MDNRINRIHKIQKESLWINKFTILLALLLSTSCQNIENNTPKQGEIKQEINDDYRTNLSINFKNCHFDQNYLNQLIDGWHWNVVSENMEIVIEKWYFTEKLAEKLIKDGHWHVVAEYLNELKWNKKKVINLLNELWYNCALREYYEDYDIKTQRYIKRIDE